LALSLGLILPIVSIGLFLILILILIGIFTIIIIIIIIIFRRNRIVLQLKNNELHEKLLLMNDSNKIPFNKIRFNKVKSELKILGKGHHF
jgi:hypothetical protein